MQRSATSSNACAHSRQAADATAIGWCPSRWLVATLALITALSPLAILVSEMPRSAAYPLGVVAVARGIALVRREARRPPRVVRFAGDEVLVDGDRVDAFELEWRGPIAFARWRDAAGRTQRLVWWPDTLPSPARRELRLAAPAPRATRNAASMAP